MFTTKCQLKYNPRTSNKQTHPIVFVFPSTHDTFKTLESVPEHIYSPIKPFLANSKVKRRVIFSNSCSVYSLGLILMPALPPPKGTSTQAHLNVISADKAFTSSLVTSIEKRIPEIKIFGTMSWKNLNYS